jgi:SM-20-related protein
VQNNIALIAEQLDRHAIAIIDDFLPTEVLNQLLSESKQLFAEDELEPAHIGRGITVQRISEVRGDKIKWLEKEDLTQSQEQYFELLERLREHLSNYFRIALPWFECHLATYPIGSFYTKHLDQFRVTNNRIFSVVLYLNENWKPQDGGQLRIHEGEEHYDIDPKMGRLVCFRSDIVQHEVLITSQPRFSITGWLRRDEPTPLFL